MAEATHTFPASFLWGTATAGYQVEGNSANSDFFQWEQRPGAIVDGQRCGPACDWWEGRRWQEDFDRAAADGHTALRLSVEWSRIEPEPGRWDEAAVDHYRAMVRGLRERGLVPMVTLHHFVSPAWLTLDGRNAWETGEVVPLFERFVDKVVRALGDYVGLWVTINEPNVLMYRGYVEGALPPAKKSLGLASQVALNFLRAHAAAYHAIHAVQPAAQVGLPVHFRPMYPAMPGFAPDEWVARTQFNLFSSLFHDAIRSGRLRRVLGAPLAVPEAVGTQDFIALQYYTAHTVRFDLTVPGELFGRRSFPLGAELDDEQFYASYPQGFFDTLRWARGFKLPIYITEAGIGDSEDSLRRRFIITHLRELWKAVNYNWGVKGFFHWTLVDNFEWDRGWRHRFGLYALDPETQVRTPRPSARLYSEIACTSSLSSDMVARYAPELLEPMFPG